MYTFQLYLTWAFSTLPTTSTEPPFNSMWLSCDDRPLYNQISVNNYIMNWSEPVACLDITDAERASPKLLLFKFLV